MKRLTTILCLFLLTGCGLPSFRVFQKKVDPKLAEKPPEQIEAERQGADYIVQRTTPPVADPAAAVNDVHQVAGALSASLGEPKKPVTVEDKDTIISNLKKGIVAEQQRADAWKAFAKKYAGQSIEGSGVDLAPWGGGLGLLGIVAACIFIPGFGTLVLFVIKRLRGTVQQVAQGVEEFAVDHPDEAKKLKAYLQSATDKAHQNIIEREKKLVDWAAVAKRKKTTPQPATATTAAA